MLVNPVIYFLFLKLSEGFVFAVEESLKIENREVSLIEMCIRSSEIGEYTTELIAESELLLTQIRMETFGRKIRRAIKILIHPVKYLQQRKLNKLMRGN